LGIYAYASAQIVLYSRTIPIFLIFIGVLVFIISFLGFFSASYENRRGLIMYSVVLSVLLLAQVIIVGIIFANPSKVDETLDTAWQQAYDYRPRILRDVENEYSCCGFKTPTDRAVPKNNPEACMLSPNFGYETACYEQLRDAYNSNCIYIGVSLVLIGIIQVLSLIFSYNLIMRLPSEAEMERQNQVEYERLVQNSRQADGQYGTTSSAT